MVKYTVLIYNNYTDYLEENPTKEFSFYYMNHNHKISNIQHLFFTFMYSFIILINEETKEEEIYQYSNFNRKNYLEWKQS